MDRESARKSILAAVLSATDDRIGVDSVMDAIDAAADITAWVSDIFGQPRRQVPAESYLGADDALREMDPTTISTIILITILTATFAERDKFPSRPSFYNRCREELTTREPSRVDALIGGLG